MNSTRDYIFETSGSHGGKYEDEDGCLLGCGAV
jgi:hypothetical protein